MDVLGVGGLRYRMAVVILLSTAVAAMAMSFLGRANASEEEAPGIEVYYAEPGEIEEFTAAPVTVTGVFPVGEGITSLETAAAIYRVYLGVMPWTTDHIAPFRLGPDDFVITPDDGYHANELRITTPAFTPPGWLDLQVVDSLARFF
jgi:hypothetical protein